MTKQMMKQMMNLLVLAGLVLALAPTAQAAPIVTPQDGYTGPYRLAFVTDGVSGAKSSAIDDYNSFVTTEAGLVTELAALDTTWKVIGSTGTVSAKVNTGTGSTGDANDVPIYTTTGLRVADDNADLWDGSIENPIWYGDGTESNPGLGNAGPEQIWTGTGSDGSSRPVGGDGSYLGSGDGGDQTADYITLVRGGYTDGNWIEGPSSHDGTPDNNRTYTKHFMALSDVIGGVPAAPFAITEIQYAPDADPNPTVTLTWRSRPGTTYKAFSSTDLSDWSNELADSLGPETEGIIVDGDLLTMTFPLENGLENDPDVLFRIEEEVVISDQ